MTTLGDKDRALFSKSEWELLRTSRPGPLKSLTKGRVKLQLRRARKLAAKYRDLTRDHRRSTKEEPPHKKNSSIAGRRTKRKSRLATEASRRFEKRLADLENESAGQRKTKKGKETSVRRQGTAVQQEAVHKANQRRGAIGLKSLAKKTKRQLQMKRTKAIQGHIRARGQWHQTRRDGK
ncbi:MAG: hypothetical protein AB7P24_20235 [Nitrospira sp.]